MSIYDFSYTKRITQSELSIDWEILTVLCGQIQFVNNIAPYVKFITVIVSLKLHQYTDI